MSALGRKQALQRLDRELQPDEHGQSWTRHADVYQERGYEGTSVYRTSDCRRMDVYREPLDGSIIDNAGYAR